MKYKVNGTLYLVQAVGSQLHVLMFKKNTTNKPITYFCIKSVERFDKYI